MVRRKSSDLDAIILLLHLFALDRRVFSLPLRKRGGRKPSKLTGDSILALCEGAYPDERTEITTEIMAGAAGGTTSGEKKTPLLLPARLYDDRGKSPSFHDYNTSCLCAN